MGNWGHLKVLNDTKLVPNRKTNIFILFLFPYILNYHARLDKSTYFFNKYQIRMYFCSSILTCFLRIVTLSLVMFFYVIPSTSFTSSITTPWDFSKCLFSPRLLNSSLLHWLHLNLIPSCTFLVCKCKFSMYRKVSLHNLHSKFLSPRWTAEKKLN